MAHVAQHAERLSGESMVAFFDFLTQCLVLLAQPVAVETNRFFIRFLRVGGSRHAIEPTDPTFTPVGATVHALEVVVPLCLIGNERLLVLSGDPPGITAVVDRYRGRLHRAKPRRIIWQGEHFHQIRGCAGGRKGHILQSRGIRVGNKPASETSLASFLIGRGNRGAIQPIVPGIPGAHPVRVSHSVGLVRFR